MENDVFLAICLGGPVVMVVSVFVMAARQFFGPNLTKIASECGWTASPHADFVFRYEASVDGVRWQLAQRRSHRHHTRRGPLEFSVDLGRSPGVLVMQRRLPDVLRGEGGALSGELLARALDVLDPRNAPVLRSLVEVPGQGASEVLVGFAPGADVSLADALGPLRDALAPLLAVPGISPVLTVLEGKLRIHVFDRNVAAGRLAVPIVNAGLAAVDVLSPRL